MFQVLGSRTFQKQLDELPKGFKERIIKGLKVLEDDPFAPRPKADIKPLKDTDPQKYRIRIGEYRIIYSIDDKTVKVIEIFIRGRGYRE